jgi:hypothetical protein
MSNNPHTISFPIGGGETEAEAAFKRARQAVANALNHPAAIRSLQVLKDHVEKERAKTAPKPD